MEHVFQAHGRRITLRVSETTDKYGQFRVCVLVNGALTGKDVEILSCHVTDKSDD